MAKLTSSAVLKPLISPSTHLPEITLRAIVLSVILTVILAASNAYLALKIGTTISASIPASVLALGILRFFKHSNVLESNIVQTAASAGEGMAAAVSFILPAMLVLHIWQGFPYFESTIICLLGGLLGVLFSIPLRKILLTMPRLGFPEGTATGNLLKASVKKGNQLRLMIYGTGIGGLITFAQSGLQILSSTIQLWMYTTRGIFGISFGLTPASLAAGYIIGLEAGVSLLVGLSLGWLVILPLLAYFTGVPDAKSAYEAAMSVWSAKLRYVGVGTMLIGGVWTLLRLLKPLVIGLRASLKGLTKSNAGQIDLLRTERDISMLWVLLGVVIVSVFLLAYLFHMAFDLKMSSHLWVTTLLVLVTLLYILIAGFLLSTVCGYITGLIGSTNNPISGLIIMAILLLATCYLVFFAHTIDTHGVRAASFVILVATVIISICTISNENIQDLKAGQIVGATPWKQQVMLAVGVVAATLVIAPVLELLFNAYGMAGVFPREGMSPAGMLAAPQAGLMAAITKGVLSHDLPWTMIFIGFAVAVGTIIANAILERRQLFLSPLAVGIAIYLPPEVMTPMITGTFISFLVKRRIKKKCHNKKAFETAQSKYQSGMLFSSGVVAGSALMGVVLAIPFVLMGSSDALAIVSAGFMPIAIILGVITFVALSTWIYKTGRVR